jgi:hypothetical protein
VLLAFLDLSKKTKSEAVELNDALNVARPACLILPGSPPFMKLPIVAEYMRYK